MRESISCPVCDTPMRVTRHEWEFRCAGCGFLASTLPPAMNVGGSGIDEGRRETALSALRAQNFKRIIERISTLVEPDGAALLDVGCAHGWFLDVAVRRGYAARGLEPDRSIGEYALRKGHAVDYGLFPHDLSPDRRYNVICFNDVFEHLKDPRGALAALHGHLRPGGLVVINLPSSRGAFFQTAAWLDRLGVRAPYERLWQKGFPSPHRSYFHPDALSRLAQREGLREVSREALESFQVKGLWQRLRFDRGMHLWLCASTWICVVAAAPLLRRLPSDISLQIFRPAQA